jgi:hypothetical protein
MQRDVYRMEQDKRRGEGWQRRKKDSALIRASGADPIYSGPQRVPVNFSYRSSTLLDEGFGLFLEN